MERELAAAALAKRQQGEIPSERELRALRRLERRREEEQRWQHYHTIPQKHWRDLSGRQPKVLAEQAATYGIPFDGKTVDLAVVARAFHDFLSRYGRRVLEQDSSGELDRRIRTAKAELEELKVKQKRDLLVDRAAAEAARLAVVRWAVGVFDRAGAELAARIAGKKPAEQRRIVEQYFRAVREQAAKRGE